MKKLKDLVKLVCNNDECVILKVKPDSQMDLICLGCFNGDEEIIRLTKGYDITCTVFTKNKNYSWEWGYSGTTLVTHSLRLKGNMIQDCIEKDFGIKCEF